LLKESYKIKDADFTIHESTLIEEIVEKAPKLIRYLREKGIVCIKCGEPVWGTLAQVAGDREITDLKSLIHEMNRLLRNG
jgi:hypothetical protein